MDAVTTSKEDRENAYAMKLYGKGERLLVTIAMDGTVTIHEEGAAPEAAKVFYDAVQVEGQTLVRRIERLREAIRDTERWLRGLSHYKMAERLRRALER